MHDGGGTAAAIAVAWCLVAFLFGSIPFGLIVGKMFYRTDIRATGSGNIGAANALRAYGRGGAFTVLILDALKGFVPAGAPLVLPVLGGGVPVAVAAAAGLFALLGHCYSPWLGFRGGKGVATHLGVLFALAWPTGLAFIAAWALTALWTSYSSAGSLAATLVSVAGLWLLLGPPGLAYGVAAAAVIFWRHRENLARLRSGTEHRMRLFKRTST